jgi:hypothetical protein
MQWTAIGMMDVALSMMDVALSAERALMKAITGTPGCWARATSGHTAAAPDERDDLAPFQ